MVYVGSVYVFDFWFLLGLSLVGLSLVGLSHQLVKCGSVCPPPLVFCCAGVGRLCCSWFFRVYKVLRLFSCSCSVICSHYLVVSPDRSWVDFMLFPLPPSPSLLICWCFLCWWVSSSMRNPGVPSFYPLFFYGRPSLGYGCACRAFLDSHSPWFLWSQFTLR